MAKKVSKRVKTLSGFMKWIEQFNDGQYLFRGVSKHTYKLEASAIVVCLKRKGTILINSSKSIES